MFETLGEEDGEIFCQIFDIIDPNINWDNLSFKNGSPPHDWFYGKLPHLKNDLTEALLERGKTLKDFDIWKKKMLQILNNISKIIFFFFFAKFQKLRV